MQTELLAAWETVIDDCGLELNPDQMDEMGKVLTGIMMNNLELIDPARIECTDDAFENLVEYATKVAVMGKMLEKLNNYKVSSNGEKLNINCEV